jgi:hypothetical protein
LGFARRPLRISVLRSGRGVEALSVVSCSSVKPEGVSPWTV